MSILKRYSIVTAILFILFAWLWLIIITEIRGKKTKPLATKTEKVVFLMEKNQF